jgi:hypothetical protein
MTENSPLGHLVSEIPAVAVKKRGRPKKIKEVVEKKPIGRPKLYNDINYKENPTEYHQKYYHKKRAYEVKCECGDYIKSTNVQKHLKRKIHIKKLESLTKRAEPI